VLSETVATVQAALKGKGRYIAVGIGLAVLLYTINKAGASETFQFTVLGIALGCVYAIAASGLVLTYTTTGVFNFAHGAVGMVGAYLYWQLRVDIGLATPLALLLVIGVFAPLIGLVLERIMRSFKDAAPGTTLTVTIALTLLLIGVIQYFYQPQDRQVPPLLGAKTVSILGANVSYDEVGFFFVAIGIAAALRLLLFRSRTGTAMRAVVDNPTLAGLNGAQPVTIARYSWMLGSVLAVTAGVLFAPTANPLDQITLTFFVVFAYGAAVFGKLKSLPLTFLGAILLGIARQYMLLVKPSGELWDHIQGSIAGLFLFGALLFLPEAKLAVGRVVGRSEPAVPGLRATVVRSVAFIPVLFVMANMAGDYLPDLTRGLIYATLLLSLVVLTGFSGQISLAQYVFFGLGAFAMGKVGGGDSLIGMGAAAAIAVPVGAITAIPAMRLQGLYLALVTFAVAVVSKELIFQDSRIYGQDNVQVGRLKLPGLEFTSNKSFLVLCGIVFALVGMGILALRRGPFGRRLAALRDSQAACATLGLDVRRTKLVVFMLSSAIAGLAGALFGGLQSSVGSIAFEPIYNVTLFLFAFVGGITTVTGALIGGMLFALLPLIQSKEPTLAGLVFAAVAGAAILLGKQPNGMAGLLYDRVRNLRPRPAAPPPARTAAPREEVPVGATA
jgi:branched-chain amino acid transport system permease protein